MSEVKAKLSIVHVIQVIVDNVACFSILLVIIKAVLYRRKFLMKDGYDNFYLTKRLFEIRRLLKGLLFWLFGAFNASYYIICDYGLYWILDLVRRHMDYSTSAAVPPHLQLHVHGQGPMADMYRVSTGG
ncbi:DC-STAMP domain-containing protein 2 [Plakobranchus ocellatus]|uniref:DC-STAMP domain-containing protein 2 n=1 Tax=Plakobranchus ocellatus TaxID=259542 RepID=A0AAV4AUG1_9GAST|nr:DC-STAMP domain-containing protein 2 [Plakobranchus ocellatus]